MQDGHDAVDDVASTFQQDHNTAAAATAPISSSSWDDMMMSSTGTGTGTNVDDSNSITNSLSMLHEHDKQINSNKQRRLEGKVAIVTGGARGIGEAIVRLFLDHGARVVIADIDDMAGQALASSLSLGIIGLRSSRCTYERCDVSVEADVERTVRRTVALHGRLDVLCNNAGVLGRQPRSILSLDAEEFERVVRVNALGAALGMKHAAAAMLQQAARGPGGGGGSIVSMASVAGVMGGMGPHAYTASKHALVGLTKNAACELGQHGIRVNCISPFGVPTSMLLNAWRTRTIIGTGGVGGSDDDAESVELEQMEEVLRGLSTLKLNHVHGATTLRTKDIAEAALFLASDDSRYVSGHNLVVDGGVTTANNLIGL